MIIAFLIANIGIIPLVLAFSTLKIYKGSELSFALLLYMVSISFWQLDVAVLYLKGVLPQAIIFLLFKIFRAGPTFNIPIVFYLSYILIRKHSTNIKNQKFYPLLLSIFNRKVLVFSLIWSVCIYIINMTKLGMTGLKETTLLNTDTSFYFPEYGPLQFLFLIHTGSFVVLIIFTLIISQQIYNEYLKSFLHTFSLFSVLLFISGFLNFIPGTGSLFSSLGIIVFSVVIVFSFVKMHTMMTVDFNRLIERQKKLDETGGLTASLVHEVKNNLQIIKGYTKLLSELTPLPENGSRMIDMIQTSSQQIDELVKNYTTYIKHQSIEYKMVDLNDIIEQAIKISQDYVENSSADISFVNKYRTLKLYANESYMKQVFVNLIKNSSEAFPADRQNKKIVIKTNIDGDKIIVDFYDSGTGIPSEKWESIFDPFNSSKKEGFGLGLPFVKKIIYEHRGDIKIMESCSGGTHFQIVLPQYSFSSF